MANKSDLYKKSIISDLKGQDYTKRIKTIWKLTSAKEEDRSFEELIDELLEINLKIQNNTNPEYIKLINSKVNSKNEGGCCKGKVINKSNDNYEEKAWRDNRINSKVSTISVEENNNKDDDEDF